MLRTQISKSPGLSSGSSAVTVEVGVSGRVLMALAIIAGGGLAALVLSPWPAGLWRACTGAVSVALAWQPIRGLIFGLGPGAVRRVTLRGDGMWEISDNAGRSYAAELSPASASLGPCLLLIWNSPASKAALRAFI